MEIGFQGAQTSWYKISTCQGCWKQDLCLIVTVPVSLVSGLGQEHIRCHSQVDCTRVWYLCGVGNISDGSGLETKYNKWTMPKELLVSCVGVCAQPRGTGPCGINLRCFEATDFPLLAGICSVHVHP